MVAQVMEATKRGHRAMEYGELASLPVLTPASSSYVPVPHGDFALNVHRLGEQVLGPQGFTLANAEYIVSKDAGRMFMMQAFEHGSRPDLKLAIAGRNSTDRSLSAAVAIGAQVVACTNGVIAGEISVMRKHTGDVLRYLEENLIISFHRATGGWNDVQEDIEKFREVSLTDTEAYRTIGEMWGKGILLPTHLNKVKRNWHEDEKFPERNLWSLYNNATEVFKGSPPHNIMQHHLGLHSWAREQISRPEDETLNLSVGEELNN